MEIAITDQFVAHVRKQPVKINPTELPDNSVRKVFEYGLQRILNDSSAGADTPEEAVAQAMKRWDALKKGIIRQARTGGGDPVAREAMRLAVAAVKKHPKFVAWLAENKLKASDKQATEKLRELAEQRAQKDDIQKLAKANVSAVDKIDVGDDEIDL